MAVVPLMETEISPAPRTPGGGITRPFKREIPNRVRGISRGVLIRRNENFRKVVRIPSLMFEGLFIEERSENFLAEEPAFGNTIQNLKMARQGDERARRSGYLLSKQQAGSCNSCTAYHGLSVYPAGRRLSRIDRRT